MLSPIRIRPVPASTRMSALGEGRGAAPAEPVTIGPTMAAVNTATAVAAPANPAWRRGRRMGVQARRNRFAVGGSRRKRPGSVRLSDIESHRTPIDLDRFPRGFHGLLQLRMSLPLQYYLEVLLSMLTRLRGGLVDRVIISLRVRIVLNLPKLNSL